MTSLPKLKCRPRIEDETLPQDRYCPPYNQRINYYPTKISPKHETFLPPKETRKETGFSTIFLNIG